MVEVQVFEGDGKRPPEVQVGESLKGKLPQAREVWIFPDETVATWRKIRVSERSTEKHPLTTIRIRWNGHESEDEIYGSTNLYAAEVAVRTHVSSWKASSLIYDHLKIYEEV